MYNNVSVLHFQCDIWTSAGDNGTTGREEIGLSAQNNFIAGEMTFDIIIRQLLKQMFKLIVQIETTYE